MPTRPLRFAHRGLPGRWQNSRRGVRAALAAGYDGVEVDVVLSRDGALVLSHDPWLHPDLVRHVDGRALEERVLIRDRTLAQLEAGFRFACAHPDHPGEAGPEEPPATLGDVVAILGAFPGRALYLDVKLERPNKKLTASARRTARALRPHLERLDPHHPVWLEGGSPAIIARYRSELGDLPFHAALSVPRFDAGVSDTLEAAIAGLAHTIRVQDPARRAARGGADAFCSPRQIVTREQAERGATRGVPAVLFGVDDAETLAKLSEWPVAALIVDHGPGITAA